MLIMREEIALHTYEKDMKQEWRLEEIVGAVFEGLMLEVSLEVPNPSEGHSMASISYLMPLTMGKDELVQ